MSSTCEQPALALRARSYVLRELPERECVVFEDHLAGCHACSRRVNALVDGLRRLEQDAAREPEAAGRAWIPAWGAPAVLAAAVVVLLLGYPAFLGLRRLPRLEQERGELERRNVETRAQYERALSDQETRTRTEIEEKWQASLFGALNEVHHLSRPVRGGASGDVLTLRGDEMLVILGVELEPADVTDGAMYRFDIQRPGGEQVWSAELSGRQVKGSLRSVGEILLPVPAEQLPAGNYEMRVAGPIGAGAKDLLAKRLTVVRP